jgi:hypothetical protein
MAIQPQLLSGARGIIKTGKSSGVSETLAIAMDISVSVRSSVRETYVMGELNPVALDPVAIDVDCSIGRVIPVNASTPTSGPNSEPPAKRPEGTAAEPSTGKDSARGGSTATSAIQLGLEDQINKILTADTIQIEIVDKISGATIAVVKEARFAGRSISTGAGDVASERLNFVGIYDAGYGGNENPTTTGYGL